VAAVNAGSQGLIRAARAADVAALARLAGELGYPTAENQMQRRLERVAADAAHRVFVAEDSAGVVVGWVQVNFTRFLASDPRGEVLGLVVAAGSRGRGLGRQLMQAAEQWTREQGGTLLSLRSNIVRKETHRFYERLGYTVTKTSLNFQRAV
jgi:GNAT superfamily N-acetyltransferase